MFGAGSLSCEWEVNASQHPKPPLPKLLWCPASPHSPNGGGSAVTCQVCSKPSVWQLCCYFCMDRHISLFEPTLKCCPSCTGLFQGGASTTPCTPARVPPWPQVPGTELLTRGMWYQTGTCSAELSTKGPQLSISMATSQEILQVRWGVCSTVALPAFLQERGLKLRDQEGKSTLLWLRGPFRYYLSKSPGTVIYH